MEQGLKKITIIEMAGSWKGTGFFFIDEPGYTIIHRSEFHHCALELSLTSEKASNIPIANITRRILNVRLWR